MLKTFTVTADSRSAERKVGETVATYNFATNEDITGVVVSRQETTRKVADGYGGFKTRRLVTLTVDTGD